MEGRQDAGRSFVKGGKDGGKSVGIGEAGRFHLSKSRMNRYIACPRSYLLNYELNITPIRQPMERLIGLAVHRLIAAHHLARKCGEITEAGDLLEKFWADYARGIADPQVLQEMAAAREASLQYAGLFLRECPLEPLEIERSFSTPLIHPENGDTLPVPLVGIVDLVDRPNGCPRAIEIKTRARRADEGHIRLSLELTCYAYWIWIAMRGGASREDGSTADATASSPTRQNREDEEAPPPGVAPWGCCSPPDEIPVGYIHIVKTKTPAIQRQEDVRTVGDFIDLYATAKAVHENIRERRFYRNAGAACAWCDYAPVCRRDGEAVRRIFGGDACLRLWENDLI